MKHYQECTGNKYKRTICGMTSEGTIAKKSYKNENQKKQFHLPIMNFSLFLGISTLKLLYIVDRRMETPS